MSTRPRLVRRIFLACLQACCFAMLLAPQAASQDEPAVRASESEDLVFKRWEWFYKQRAFPLEHIPAGARGRALRELDSMRTSEREAVARRTEIGNAQPAVESSTSWTLIGPQPVNVPANFLGRAVPCAPARSAPVPAAMARSCW